jgi:hypothetical protein
VADGADTLGDLLALLAEALVLLASCFYILCGLRKTRGHLGGAAGTTPPRVCTVILRVLLHPGELLFNRRHSLFGGTLFDRHGS